VRAWFWVAASRVTALFTSRRLDEDFDAEVRIHIEMLTDEHVRRGMARDEARRDPALWRSRDLALSDVTTLERVGRQSIRPHPTR